MAKTFVCDKHGSEQSGTCADCVKFFESRQNADEMTGDERAAEFKWWGSILTIPFGDLHQRIEELVGRPVFTHEMAGDVAVDRLIEEARTRQRPSFSEILDRIPADKRVVIAQTD